MVFYVVSPIFRAALLGMNARPVGVLAHVEDAGISSTLIHNHSMKTAAVADSCCLPHISMRPHIQSFLSYWSADV